MKTKVVIADDHHMVRQMLVHTLASYEELEIVAQACSGQEVIFQLDPNQLLTVSGGYRVVLRRPLDG